MEGRLDIIEFSFSSIPNVLSVHRVDVYQYTLAIYFSVSVHCQ